MQVRVIPVKSILTPTRIPGADFAANPYIGCSHACKYCYASFMKRFTNHPEPWGSFVDVKIWPPIQKPVRYAGKKINFGTVTDPYLPQEKQFERTRVLLEGLQGSEAHISILTKSTLVLRDIDLLKQFECLQVTFSINTLDERFRKDMEETTTIQRRFDALRGLKQAGIRTGVFISPIFPRITEPKEICLAVKGIADEIWMENLNLRGDYRIVILNYIRAQYPDLLPLYERIYRDKDDSYWETLSVEMQQFAQENQIQLTNYFYHEKTRKPKP
ncbi:MAG: radical SAM protein [Anaerolineaceae bacterium]|jgi:DNA repair photolyase